MLGRRTQHLSDQVELCLCPKLLLLLQIGLILSRAWLIVNKDTKIISQLRQACEQAVSSLSPDRQAIPETASYFPLSMCVHGNKLALQKPNPNGGLHKERIINK